MKFDNRILIIAAGLFVLSIMISLLADLVLGGIYRTIGNAILIVSVLLFVLAFIFPWVKKKEAK